MWFGEESTGPHHVLVVKQGNAANVRIRKEGFALSLVPTVQGAQATMGAVHLDIGGYRARDQSSRSSRTNCRFLLVRSKSQRSR